MIKFLICIAFCSHFIETKSLNGKFVDMTHVFDVTTLRVPLYSKFKIVDQTKGPSDFLVTKWLQHEEFSTSTHTGTHMDAPAHVIEGAITVDKIPPQAFFGPAVVIDITQKSSSNPDAEATIEDLQNWEKVSGQSLNGTIVLLNSGWGQKWSDRDAFLGTPTDDLNKLHFPGFSATACEWLVSNRDIKGVGSDTASIDVGQMISSPCHGFILGNGHYILENVANVDELPIYGAKLHTFPMKIGKGSAAPTRIVALIP